MALSRFLVPTLRRRMLEGSSNWMRGQRMLRRKRGRKGEMAYDDVGREEDERDN